MEFRTYSTVGHTNSTSAFCLLYSIVQSVRPIHTAEELYNCDREVNGPARTSDCPADEAMRLWPNSSSTHCAVREPTEENWQASDERRSMSLGMSTLDSRLRMRMWPYLSFVVPTGTGRE
jgi:hypothetical protein